MRNKCLVCIKLNFKQLSTSFRAAIQDGDQNSFHCNRNKTRHSIASFFSVLRDIIGVSTSNENKILRVLLAFLLAPVISL